MKFLRVFSLCALLAFPACAQTTNAPRTPGGVALDADASDFITRAGIREDDQKARLNRFVTELKAANLWTNFDAIYPLCGGTSNSCAQNLVSSNWGVEWIGQPTFLKRGVRGEATSYGDTHYLQSTRNTLTNNFHLYCWAQLEADGQNHAGMIIGNMDQLDGTIFNHAIGGIFTDYIGSPIATNYMGGFMINYTNPVSPEFIVTRRAGNALSSRNGNSCIILGDPYDGTGGLISTNLGQFVTPTNSVKLMGDPLGGFPARTSSTFRGTLYCASLGRGLTYSQGTNYFAIVNRYVSAVRTPNKLFTLPTSSAPGLPTGVNSTPTTNVPLFPH